MGANPHLKGGSWPPGGAKPPSLGSLCLYIEQTLKKHCRYMRDSETFGSPLTVLPTQNPVIFNNYFLKRTHPRQLCYREKISCSSMKK